MAKKYVTQGLFGLFLNFLSTIVGQQINYSYNEPAQAHDDTQPHGP